MHPKAHAPISNILIDWCISGLSWNALPHRFKNVVSSRIHTWNSHINIMKIYRNKELSRFSQLNPKFPCCCWCHWWCFHYNPCIMLLLSHIIPFHIPNSHVVVGVTDGVSNIIHVWCYYYLTSFLFRHCKCFSTLSDLDKLLK
jgi:hypothetical protein